MPILQIIKDSFGNIQTDPVKTWKARAIITGWIALMWAWLFAWIILTYVTNVFIWAWPILTIIVGGIVVRIRQIQRGNP